MLRGRASGIVVVTTCTLVAVTAYLRPSFAWSADGGATGKPWSLWGIIPTSGGRRRAITAKRDGTSSAGDDEEGQEVVLVLDVDGTLYDQSTGLEAQIVRRIKEFGARHFDMSGEECDELHHKYGSTIAGLQITRNLSEEQTRSFYAEVWTGLDYSGLHQIHTSSEEGGDKAGYRHRSPLSALLTSPHMGPLVLASNSPSYHVHRVLSHLGLAKVPFRDIITPDRLPGYPTKSSPSYWAPLLSSSSYGGGRRDMVLIDDSENNLRVAKGLGIRGVKVSDSVPVERAIASALGAIPSPDEWSMDECRYIREKNVVDGRAFNTMVTRTLQAELAAARQQQQAPSTLRVLDLGAGLLSMLPRVTSMANEAGWEAVHYTAYEMNAALVSTSVDMLKAQGWSSSQEGEGTVVVMSKGETTVKIIASDFTTTTTTTTGTSLPPPHLVVGCCLADLYDPREFTHMLLRTISNTSQGGDEVATTTGGGGPLVYLPITFAGKTCLRPTHRGDDKIFDAYHRHLTEREGHCLDPCLLVSAMEEHGASLLAQGPATWVIDREEEELGFLWECLLYFFSLGVSPSLGYGKTRAWRERILRDKPTIEVGNVDLLFRLEGTATTTALPPLLPPPQQPQQQEQQQGSSDPSPTTNTTTSRREEKSSSGSSSSNTYVEFVGPRQVRSVVEEWGGDDDLLGEGQVEVKAVCSLISSGTELKVYRGDFDKDSAVDVNIKGMASETLSFPLRYGYSLVGRVVRCGAGVDANKWEGRLVFAFVPHATRHRLSEDQLILVPEGIAAEDAVYMPSMETALSIVHDAAPIAGERVAVVGAGLIGLLATAILSRHHQGGGGSVVAIDPLPRRREVARAVGATRAISPQDVGKVEGSWDQDVCLELSGVASGLQTAIDATGYGGKIVIGSWYGNKPVPLRLGLGFHRSHHRIVVSQVSNISAPLLDRWSKARRFEYTWDLVRHLRPSGFLTTLATKPEEAASGYAALDQRPAEELAVMIRYT